MGLKIIQSFIKNNPCYKNNTYKDKYGFMVHSTATPGAKANGFIDSWNKSSSSTAVEFIIDDTGVYQLLPLNIRSWHCGASGNNTHVGCEICEPEECRLLSVEWIALYRNNKNNPVWAVKRAQQELMACGYDPNGVDGSFGPGMQSAVKQFQKDNGLSVDGSIGPATLKKLQTRNGSYLKYNVANNKKYFEDVYEKCILLADYVLDNLDSTNVSKTTVLSHAEGYKQGIASNHADIGHWWPEHGKTMDNFRADLQEYRNTGKLPFSSNLENSGVSEWAKEAWNKAVGKEIMDGTNPQNAVTREMLAVILDKLNLL